MSAQAFNAQAAEPAAVPQEVLRACQKSSAGAVPQALWFRPDVGQAQPDLTLHRCHELGAMFSNSIF
jgi:hypothetical protein